MLNENEISKYKFARIIKRPDAEKFYKVYLSTKCSSPKGEDFLKYAGYKQWKQYVTIELRVVLGDYVYYKRDGKCWRAPYNLPQKAGWYCLEELEDFYLEENLRVNVGGLL